MSRRLLSIFLVAVCASCGGGAVSRSSDDTTQTVAKTESTIAPTKALVWTPCGELECSTLSVPIDRGNASSTTVDLAVYRRVSKQPNSPHIPLIIHPGGPGADVKQAVESVDELLAPMIQDFDVYGLSTRGTFDGKGYDCVEFLDDVLAANSDPAAAERFAKSCAKSIPELVGNVGTRDTVADLEDLRRAMSLDQVRFLGWSYGATIGATWALLHPASIETMVLDAPADPRYPWADQLPYAFRAGKRSLVGLFDACDKDATCGKDEPLAAVYSRVVERVEQGEISTSSDKFDARKLALAVEMPLYDGSFQQLADALRSADLGDVAQLVDLLYHRLGQTSDRHNDGGIETQIGVHCADMSRADVDASLAIIGEGDATTGFGGAFERICAALPDAPRPIGDVQVTAVSKAAKVMVFSTEGDPIIPFEVSSTLAKEMGWQFRVQSALQHLTVGFDAASTREAMNFLRVAN